MKKSTLEVIQREIEFSRRGTESMREGSRKTRNDDFRQIYEGLASIFKGYAVAFWYILLEEGIQGSPSEMNNQEPEVTTPTEKIQQTAPKPPASAQ